MKTKIMIFLLLLSSSTMFAQPWMTGGNAAASGDYLGTNNNQPLLFHTFGIERVHINPNRTQTISGYTFNSNGFIGIGQNSVAPTHPNGVWNDFGPFSILHINGFGGSEVKPSGFRPWMQAGVTFTDNNDLSYVGLRKMGTGTERTEMVIAWSDNLNVPGSIGPDDLVFRFLTPGTGNTSFASSLNTTNDIDGRNIARFTPDGKMALGSTFGDPVEFSAFVRPASLLHMSVVGGLEAFLQITQEDVTGQTADDGLRLGIHQQTDNGLLRWQEITPFVVQTDWDAIPGGLGLSNGERLRISSINAPGVPNPSGLDINTTRLAISHIGNLPLTEPRSLIHAGRNTTATGDGWRSWMDVGMFLNNGSDNLFLGLKQEISHQIDRFDAVLNWGDNQTSPGSIGPDNLRFIFTSTLGVGNPPANSANGLETARISPAVATTMGTNYGMMGIGDFSPTGPNAAPINQPNAKLDIDGDLRIRTVTPDNTLTQILAIDPTDKNRVHWIDGSNLGGNVTADNGVSVNANNVVQLGVPCQDALGNNNLPAITANAFSEDRVVAIGDFNLWFATYTGDKGGVGIGGQPASTPFCGTGNTLEISANGASKYGTTVSSGLRFTQLKSTDNTLPNGTNGLDNTKVLTVDEDGDVVLVDAVGGGGLGNLCSQPQNPLISSHEIPLNDFNFIFSGQGAIGNNVGIGTTCTPIAKLEVMQSSGNLFSTALKVDNIDVLGIGADVSANGPFAVKGLALLEDPSTLLTTGVYGEGSYNSTKASIGVRGNANGSSSTNYAGYFQAVSSANNPNENYGVDCTAKNALYNYGGRFIGQGFNGTTIANYGVYCVANGTAGINTAIFGQVFNSGDYAGYFEGDVNVNGNFTATSGSISDVHLKENINNITNATDIIKQLQPKRFNFNTVDFPYYNLQEDTQYGLIAQEVETILPELVYETTFAEIRDSLGNILQPNQTFKALYYTEFIPFLIAGMKEQQDNLESKDSIIEDLETRLAYLENCIRNANICTEGNRTINTEPSNTTNYKSVELTNNSSIILDQNLPNPFAENTVINYNIPTDVMEAKLLFYDLNGRIIKELIIDERGESKLTVYGENLQSGVYTYSLIADGKLIATKKMVKK